MKYSIENIHEMTETQRELFLCGLFNEDEINTLADLEMDYIYAIIGLVRANKINEIPNYHETHSTDGRSGFSNNKE